jgi:2-oxoglutarate dehydrogenase E1 component
MTRQEKNEQFLLSSFLYGGNADYIEGLYARYKADPKSVDPTWASYFGRLEDSPQDIEKNAEGPSWQRADWPQLANGDLVSALDGNWSEVSRIAVRAQDAAVARARPEAGLGRARPTSSRPPAIRCARS